MRVLAVSQGLGFLLASLECRNLKFPVEVVEEVAENPVVEPVKKTTTKKTTTPKTEGETKSTTKKTTTSNTSQTTKTTKPKTTTVKNTAK